jgi:hypothetical protein
VAENSQIRWKIVLDYPMIEVVRWMDLSPHVCPISIDMVDRQELEAFFSAAGTLRSIVFQYDAAYVAVRLPDASAFLLAIFGVLYPPLLTTDAVLIEMRLPLFGIGFPRDLRLCIPLPLEFLGLSLVQGDASLPITAMLEPVSEGLAVCSNF